MNSRIAIPVFAAVFGLLPLSVLSGGMSPDLVAQISKMNDSQLVRAWIRLPESAQGRQLRLRAAQAATMVDRHSEMILSLQADRTTGQAGLKSALDLLAASGKARHIKQHWITNVVEAEVAASQLTALANRSDVATVFLAPEIKLIDPINPPNPVAATPDANTYTVNLRRIRADVAHTAGFTGKGRLICSFDTSVDGAHPALRTRWRGYNGSSIDSAASWFDPVTHSKYPRVLSASLSPFHGTHVMGIMVGWDSTGSRMYGVAPDAKWISAAVIDMTGASILDAFEWAADPDGDPNTIDDVPDVINHSWGYQRFFNYDVGCQDLFFDAIDNTEALGIVNIFAAGNHGSFGAQTIYNPANRANDSLDCFAIGNTDTVNVSPPRLHSTSSRGPSTCNGAVKPNVVAPGTGILSTMPNNTYNNLTGTSMAAPHVSGLVALLRQKNPNATVAQIKQAILISTNRYTWPIPNDSSGWGQIDCMAALDSLAANPAATINLRLYDFVHAPIVPGSTVTGTLRILNSGTNGASNVSALITGTHPSLTILDGLAVFGPIAAGNIGTAGDQIQVVVSDTVTPGSMIAVPMTIVANGYSTGATLHFLVEPRSYESIAAHTTGRIQFSLSNFGVMGMAPGSFVPLGAKGFTFDGSGNNFFEAGLMAATGPGSVVSGVHSLIYSYDNDFKVAPGGNMQFVSPGPIAAQQTYSILTDSSALAPIGLRFVQESFSDTAPNNDFIILRYIFTNLSAGTLASTRVGLFLDWDVAYGTTNAGGFDLNDSVLWMCNNTGTTETPILGDFRVSRLLDGPFSSGFTQNGAYVYLKTNNSAYDGFTPLEKYSFMTDGTATATAQASAKTELVQVLAAGPIPLSPGGTDTVAFALAAGPTYAEAGYAALRAQNFYDSVVHGPHSDIPDEPPGLPKSFVLHQNFPNPFNPGTTIAFDLPRAADYRLEIFDLLGRRVEQLTGHAAAGRVKLRWNGENAASGVYLYRLTSGEYSSCRKMILLK